MARVEPTGKRLVVIIYQESLENQKELVFQPLQKLLEYSIPSYDCLLMELNTFRSSQILIKASHILVFIDMDSHPEAFDMEQIISKIINPDQTNIKMIAQSSVADIFHFTRNTQVFLTSNITNIYSWIFFVLQHIFPYQQPSPDTLENTTWTKPECLVFFEEGNPAHFRLFEEFKPGLDSVDIPCLWPEHEDFRSGAKEELISQLKENTVLLLLTNDGGSDLRQTYDAVLKIALEKNCKMFLLNPEETTLDERQCDLGYVYNTDDMWLWIDLLAQFRIVTCKRKPELAIDNNHQGGILDTVAALIDVILMIFYGLFVLVVFLTLAAAALALLFFKGTILMAKGKEVKRIITRIAIGTHVTLHIGAIVTFIVDIVALGGISAISTPFFIYNIPLVLLLIRGIMYYFHRQREITVIEAINDNWASS